MAGLAVETHGGHNQMPLTEYSASPTKDEAVSTTASTSIPSDFLLPDGHPDVWRNLLLSKYLVNTMVVLTPCSRL